QNSVLENDFRELSGLFNKSKNRHIDNELLDLFQSYGERMSSKIISAYLNKCKIKSKAFCSWELGLRTDSDFGNAEPLESSYHSIKKKIKTLDLVPVITGFIGKNEDGKITTLGRGGSDYSAAIFGSAIDAGEIQVWTDVDGMMSTDPKLVRAARTIGEVSFSEASELAYFGARVLHPKTMLPAVKKNIPIKILNSFNPKNHGTTILSRSFLSRQPVKAIAFKKNVTLVHIESTRMLGAIGFLARIFYIFDKNRKSVDVVSTSEVSVSITLDNCGSIDHIIKELKEFSNVEISKGKSIICVVGEGIKNSRNLISRTFSSLEKSRVNIEMISQGASKINLTFIVNEKDLEKSVKILHREYFGD
ncbi:MAG TPA: aspartate kinase, partial [Candidatus Nanoarchaeia archaeon]|nr:aspartate kinase [Candidatus Nanoarchaeia archaeon]